MIDALIHDAWCQMIGTARIHKKLGITAGHVKTLRHQTRKGRKISLDKKLKLLHLSGWDPGAKQWTDGDMVALLQFNARAGEAALQFGAAYILEKFKAVAQ